MSRWIFPQRKKSCARKRLIPRRFPRLNRWRSSSRKSGFAACSLPPSRNCENSVMRELIARGGMGVVYAAEDEKLHRRVALKVLDAVGTNAELTQRLIREARILAQLEHPGIVPVHDVGTLPDGRVFYTMKFVEGLRLDEYIKQLDSLPQRLRLFLRVCDAVAFAHARSVLHRDLKPANVMVGSFGEVLVMDWGLAKILQEPAAPEETVVVASQKKISSEEETQATVVTGHGTVMGTPGYM